MQLSLQFQIDALTFTHLILYCTLSGGVYFCYVIQYVDHVTLTLTFNSAISYYAAFCMATSLLGLVELSVVGKV